MDTINIFLSVWKLFSVIQGLVCGGLVAAGILLSWMLRSNLHGETETEKEFAQQHKISYYQIDRPAHISLSLDHPVVVRRHWHLWLQDSGM